MAKLSFEQIKDIIEAGTPKWVKSLRSYTKKLQVHINGIGTAEYLNHIEGYENSTQYSLRKDFATSNKFVFTNLLRPVDKVFSASGGSTIIKTKTETSEKLLSVKLADVSGGVSLKKWIQKIQSNKYYSDPGGLVFFEWTKDRTFPTLKDISSTRNYESNGRNVEWVLFEPFKRETNGKEHEGDYYRIVDDSYDYLIHVVDGNYTVIEEESYTNPWGYVPAIINSDILDSTLTYHVSPVDSVIDLADNYLRSMSIKNIYEFLHGYPMFWAYVQPCRRCDGTGLYEGKDCALCDGEGHTFKKDVSDVIKLRPPATTEEPKLAPDVAGYVEPSTGTPPEMRTNLDWIWGLMHFTMWGTSRQQTASNETATAAFIDVQPVNDRLNMFSDAFEQTEKLMTDIIGKFYVRENYEGASVNNGRRYMVEPPDVIWQKYQAARTSGSPKVSLDYLLMQFYQTEFKDDIINMAAATKGIKIEPFVHKTDEEINSLPVKEEDKLAKYYFNEFWKRLSTQDIILFDVDKLDAEFGKYLINKTKTNE